MKRILPLWLAVMLGAFSLCAGIAADEAPAGTAVAGDDDLLKFVNGDKLHGSFVGFDKEGRVCWRSPEAKESALFDAGNVLSVKFAAHELPAGVAEPSHSVTLTNGDELRGTVVSLDDKVLVLDTWYAGKLSIARLMIRSIIALQTSGGSIIYSGPASTDGWTISPQLQGTLSWTCSNDTFVSSSYGIIGRDVKLPDLASVNFDLDAGGAPVVNIGLYASQLDEIDKCYVFRIHGSFVYLKRGAHDDNNGLESARLPEELTLGQEHKLQISICVNKSAKKLWLFVNGALIKQWTDPAGFAGTGTALLFSSQRDTRARISNIRVANWNGDVSATGWAGPDGDSPAAGVKLKEDSIEMGNHDKLSGKLKRIENGNVFVASAYSDLTIPLSRIGRIFMSDEGADVPKHNAGDLRAYFSGSGHVTMQVESTDGKQINGVSPNFGKAVFSFDAFQRLEFNFDAPSAAETPQPKTPYDGNIKFGVGD